MAEEKIILSIELDEKDLNKSILSVEKKAVKAGKNISKNLNKAGSSGSANESVNKLNDSITKLNDSLGNLGTELESSQTATRDFFLGIAATSFVLSNFTKEVGDVAAAAIISFSTAFQRSRKSIFGFNTVLLGASASFKLLATSLKDTESALGQFLKVGAVFGAFITGSLSLGITLLIVKTGKLVTAIGTRLVRASIAASEAFQKADLQLLIFTKTIDGFNRATGGAVGTSSEWLAVVNDLSESFNVSIPSLQKAAAEIVNVGSKIGLTADQQKELLRVSTEVAKINSKDLFDTTVRLVTALQGNAQAVQALGFKMTESASKSFLFKKGIDKSFKSLKDSTKVQVRYTSLMEQFIPLSGIAAEVSGSLADQTNKLAVNMDKLNTSVGRGASKIENLNLATFAFNKLLEMVPDVVFEITGTITAFAGRALQIIGTLLTFGFQIFAVTKAIQLLSLVLNTSLVKTAFGASIPLVGRSITQLLTTLAGAPVVLTSTGAAFTTFATIIRVQAIRALKGLLPLLTKIATHPIVLALVAITLLFTTYAKALAKIEEQTGVFAETLDIASSALQTFGGIFGPIGKFLNNFAKSMSDLAERVFGQFVSGLTSMIKFLADLAAKDSMNIFFSKETQGKIAAMSGRLGEFNNKLKAANFEIFSFGNNAPAALQKVSNGFSIASESINVSFEDIKDGFKDAWKSMAITGKRIGKVLQRTFVSGMSSAFSSFGKALATGKNAFNAFGKSVLNTLGGLAIQMGQFFIAVGLGMTATAGLLGLSGGAAIAAGIGLTVLGGVLQGLGGGGGSTSASGAATTDTVDGPQFDPDQLEKEKQSVTVNIQGDVMDSEETGTRIAQILTDQFQAEGVEVVRAV